MGGSPFDLHPMSCMLCKLGVYMFETDHTVSNLRMRNTLSYGLHPVSFMLYNLNVYMLKQITQSAT